MPTTTLHFPGDDEVHVWCADPSELERNGLIEPAHALLTAEETERLRRFHFNSDRLLFLATRVLVRQVLSRYEIRRARRLDLSCQRSWSTGDCGSKVRAALQYSRIPRGSSSVLSPARWMSASMSKSLARTKPTENFDHFLAPREAQALRLLTTAEQDEFGSSPTGR